MQALCAPGGAGFGSGGGGGGPREQQLTRAPPEGQQPGPCTRPSAGGSLVSLSDKADCTATVGASFLYTREATRRSKSI